MFEKIISEQYPFLSEYFENILQNTNRIPQSILFYGQDIKSQYKFATEIARILNCTGSKDELCQCVNCRWIREKTHPAVLTITNIDSKPQGDETKIVISMKQAQMIKSSLVNTSDNYRVFILCGAKIENEIWTPTGLNFENFKAEAANSLLKIVEEAPKNTIFFFLTNDKSDIIPTILSRSQAFFVPSFNKDKLTFSGVKSIFEDYPNFEASKLFEYSQTLQNSLKLSENIFDKCQNYLLSVLKTNIGNNVVKQRVIEDVKIFEQAKQKYKLGIKPDIIADDLFLALMRK
ncbi:hypothetical protein IJ732_03560 [bacterium]|nr:hypothetical protein [bacterium]